jgi:hypothetical protein
MLALLASELDHRNIKKTFLGAPACFAELDASTGRVSTCLGKKGLNFRENMG